MASDEFTRLYKYLDKRFDEIDKRFENVFKRFDTVFGMLDTVIKSQETQEHEMLALGHNVDRLNKWTHQLADKAKVILQA